MDWKRRATGKTAAGEKSESVFCLLCLSAQSLSLARLLSDRTHTFGLSFLPRPHYKKWARRPAARIFKRAGNNAGLHRGGRGAAVRSECASRPPALHEAC